MNNYDEKDFTKDYFRFVLRRYRTEADLSLDELAQRIGISKSFCGNMEAGLKWPNVNMLIRIAGALNVRPGELLDALVEEANKK